MALGLKYFSKMTAKPHLVLTTNYVFDTQSVFTILVISLLCMTNDF